MKLKLTHNQFITLFNIFKSIVGDKDQVPPPDHFEARLMLSILSGIYKTLYKKAVERKNKYSISLTEAEALAFWIFFNKWEVFEEEQVFEATLVATICNSIHQKFTV